MLTRSNEAGIGWGDKANSVFLRVNTTYSRDGMLLDSRNTLWTDSIYEFSARPELDGKSRPSSPLLDPNMRTKPFLCFENVCMVCSSNGSDYHMIVARNIG